MTRIAIVGGGISGLTAAWQLARLQTELEVTLFEASPRLGGIIETVREGGFTIECGPDSWVSEKPWARELALELGLESELIGSSDHTRKTHILLEGKLHTIPAGMRMMVPTDLEAIDSSPLFSPAARQAYRDEVTRAPELRNSIPQHDESVASFIRRHFGEEVLARLAAPLLSGVFGGDVETLSVRAVMAPFVAMEREHGSLIAGLRMRTTSHDAPPLFTSLKSGLGTLVDRMIAEIPSGWIERSNPVLSLQPQGSRWKVNARHGGSRVFDSILLATSTDSTRELLAGFAPRAATLLPTDASSAVLIAFAFPQGSVLHLPGGFGFLAPPSSGSRLLACTFVDQKFTHRAPEGGHLLRAFFGGDNATRLTACNNDEVAAIARLELARILGPLPDPQITVVRRWPRSLPQYAVGHLERMTELDAEVRRWPELYLLGNAYRGVGLPDLIRDSRAAARSAARSEA